LSSDRTIPVKRYLMALRDHDWVELRACLAPDVVRIGPYRDVYDGREAYAVPEDYADCPATFRRSMLATDTGRSWS
jgi:hypothetical protein